MRIINYRWGDYTIAIKNCEAEIKEVRRYIEVDNAMLKKLIKRKKFLESLRDNNIKKRYNR